MFRLLFLLFLVIPLIEIYLLIQVGEVIGAGWTIFFVVGTAVLGAYLLRLQGFATFQRAQANLAQGKMPAIEMIEGLFLLISGALLLTPGFATDTIGFVLLVPFCRRAIAMLFISKGVLKAKQQFYTHSQQRYQSNDETIIEGEIVTDPTEISSKKTKK